ncbi:hypothetical protein [Sphaerisporangium sp. TRM90804]|uniref:hypothetical protein n=1 Tax=Sphaerisporangium sp. TRM90804 TaxID=3031113 RepID=UPI00244B4FD6|nr:hypothetical protein [Sphaerisporangium sp. TRM90804]MDH2425810.1 hypothetical protein [Sphaerisporangium sp. TRM90804]
MGLHRCERPPRPARYVAAALALAAPVAGGLGAALALWVDAPAATVYTVWAAVLGIAAATGLTLGLRARALWGRG